MDIRKRLTENAETYASRPAIYFKGREISFIDLKETSLSIGAALLGMARGKKSHIGIYLPNAPEYIYSYCGVYSTLNTAVPLDFMLTNDELIGILKHSDADYLIAFNKKGFNPERILSETSVKKVILVDPSNTYNFSENVVDFYKLVSEYYGKAPGPFVCELSYSEEDTAAIFYTSGTTGVPKGVVLSYRHLDAPAEAMKYFLDLTSNDIAQCAIPLNQVIP